MRLTIRTSLAALALLAAVSCDSQVVTSLISGILEGIGGEQIESLLPADGTSEARPSGDIPALMEIPTGRNDVNVLVYDGYVSSYNTSTLIPDWVAYELTADETYGDAGREDKMFSMDPDFKKKQAMREDYKNSGWTKGHMAPAADFRWDDDAMTETFYFQNCCPQNEELNANDWEYLERQVRRWAKEFGKVWVVTGPIIGDNIYGTIGDRDVVVPDSFFKAVLACKNGKYRSIAFIMNNDSERYYLQDCALSVDELEKITGIDFYPALDDNFEESVESVYKLSDWGIRKR